MAKEKQKKKKRGSGKIAVFLALMVIAGALLYRGQQNGTLRLPESGGSGIVSSVGEWFSGIHSSGWFTDLKEQGGNLLAVLREKGGDLFVTVREKGGGLIAEIFGFEPPPQEGTSQEEPSQEQASPEKPIYTLDTLPEYSGSPYVELEGNVPSFWEAELTTTGYEVYSQLDLLGRCGEARACIGPELMPTEERGPIGMVKPSGWQTVRYDDRIDGKYLYNRCHLIGYQLTGENANEMNLITGTRYLNVEGMLPFENAVADYIQETGNHVMYRVTPIFRGLELVARGVVMEAYSVEDEGAGVCFHVYCYNVQPGVGISYLTGDSWAEEDYTP